MLMFFFCFSKYFNAVYLITSDWNLYCFIVKYFGIFDLRTHFL